MAFIKDLQFTFRTWNSSHYYTTRLSLVESLRIENNRDQQSFYLILSLVTGSYLMTFSVSAGILLPLHGVSHAVRPCHGHSLPIERVIDCLSVTSGRNLGILLPLLSFNRYTSCFLIILASRGSRRGCVTEREARM